MAKIIIPTQLRKYTEDRAAHTVPEAKDVEESLHSLTESYPELRRFLIQQNGKLGSFVRVYVDETDIQSLQGAATPVFSHHTISLIPSLTEEL